MVSIGQQIEKAVLDALQYGGLTVSDVMLSTQGITRQHIHESLIGLEKAGLVVKYKTFQGYFAYRLA